MVRINQSNARNVASFSHIAAALRRLLLGDAVAYGEVGEGERFAAALALKTPRVVRPPTPVVHSRSLRGQLY